MNYYKRTPLPEEELLESFEEEVSKREHSSDRTLDLVEVFRINILTGDDS